MIEAPRLQQPGSGDLLFVRPPHPRVIRSQPGSTPDCPSSGYRCWPDLVTALIARGHTDASKEVRIIQ
jgi:hypothetical protein